MEQVVSLFLEVLNFVVDQDGNVCHVQTEWPCCCGSPACVVSVTVSSVQHRADPDSADFTGRDLLLRPAPIWDLACVSLMAQSHSPGSPCDCRPLGRAEAESVPPGHPLLRASPGCEGRLCWRPCVAPIPVVSDCKSVLGKELGHPSWASHTLAVVRGRWPWISGPKRDLLAMKISSLRGPTCWECPYLLCLHFLRVARGTGTFEEERSVPRCCQDLLAPRGSKCEETGRQVEKLKPAS